MQVIRQGRAWHSECLGGGPGGSGRIMEVMVMVAGCRPRSTTGEISNPGSYRSGLIVVVAEDPSFKPSNHSKPKTETGTYRSGLWWLQKTQRQSVRSSVWLACRASWTCKETDGDISGVPPGCIKCILPYVHSPRVTLKT